MNRGPKILLASLGVLVLVGAGLGWANNRQSAEIEVIESFFEGSDDAFESYPEVAGAEQVWTGEVAVPPELVAIDSGLPGRHEIRFRVDGQEHRKKVTMVREGGEPRIQGLTSEVTLEVGMELPYVPDSALGHTVRLVPGTYRTAELGPSAWDSNSGNLVSEPRTFVIDAEPEQTVALDLQVSDLGHEAALDTMSHLLSLCPGANLPCPEVTVPGVPNPAFTHVRDIHVDVTDESPDHYGGTVTVEGSVIDLDTGGDDGTLSETVTTEMYVDLTGEFTGAVPVVVP